MVGSEYEEVSVDINGGPYPLTDPGGPAGCQAPLQISGGNLIGPVGTLGAGQDVIITEDMNSITVRCTPFSGVPRGITFSIAICCVPCETEAGEIIASPLNLCPSDFATVPFPTGTMLDSDDILEYILFSNLADTLGSIIATNGSPEFSFDPSTMSTGITYYIAAIAGNDNGGNVDLSDGCLDISNAIEVIWHPEPSVEFTAIFTDVCADGCYDIVIDFTGTPPFHLQGEITDANNTVIVFDETYPGNTATLNICLPANTPIGNLTIQATSLSDNYCECN